MLSNLCLLLFVPLATLAGEEMMSNHQQPPESTGQERRGSIRQGTTIQAVDSRLRFEIPAAWVRWHEENAGHPSLHLTPAELDSVEHAEGEWDQEFATVVDAILPFDRCVAHVGSEGWGARGISYADLQVRAYVLTDSPAEIENRATTRGAAAVTSFTGSPAVPRHETAGEWRRTLLEYRRTYEDYGATAFVDLRTKAFDHQTVVFAFMYTDHANHQAEIEGILASAEISPSLHQNP